MCPLWRNMRLLTEDAVCAKMLRREFRFCRGKSFCFVWWFVLLFRTRLCFGKSTLMDDNMLQQTLFFPLLKISIVWITNWHHYFWLQSHGVYFSCWWTSLRPPCMWLSKLNVERVCCSIKCDTKGSKPRIRVGRENLLFLLQYKFTSLHVTYGKIRKHLVTDQLRVMLWCYLLYST